MAQQSSNERINQLKRGLRWNMTLIVFATMAMMLFIIRVAAGWQHEPGWQATFGPVANAITFAGLVYLILERIKLTAQLYAQKG